MAIASVRWFRHPTMLPPGFWRPYESGCPPYHLSQSSCWPSQMQAENRHMLSWHSLWVIRGIPGPCLCKTYLADLCEKDERAGEIRFVKRYFLETRDFHGADEAK